MSYYKIKIVFITNFNEYCVWYTSMRQQPHDETIKDINRVTYSIQNQCSIYNKTVHKMFGTLEFLQ